MSRLAAGVLVALVLATTGCGLKGPLYLPEKSEVTIRPAPAAGAVLPAEPAATEAPTAPETPATPETPPEDPPSTGPGRD